jgi:NAD(P)-dependent dehydrogenase (short-subunit alcohol dehydrogenase family)
VWLVTGASSGLGLAITLAALSAGHRVIATARDTSKAASNHPEVQQRGGTWLQLDVRDSTTKDVVAGAIEKEGGRLDCLVNNAGYTAIGPVEDWRSVIV